MTDHFLTSYEGLPALGRLYFVARNGAGVPQTGLVGGFTVYLAKNGGAAALITPTLVEVSAANMPGIYRMTLTTGNLDTAGNAVILVTHASMEPSVLFVNVLPRGIDT